MLPIIILIFINCLLDVTSSPVYNMQPAHITANIGTIGRNIRNLPCISRKSNQSGVCMFAIDCLKANGTHLGTCIDRFYFGSCCHVEQSHEILDNSIDSSIFPQREPPLRLSTTEKTTSTIKLPDKVATGDTKKPISATNVTKPVSSSVTTSPMESPTTTGFISTSKTTTTPKKEPTSKLPIILTKEPAETTENYKFTTFQSVDGIVTTFKTVSQTKIPTEGTTSTTTAKATSVKQKPIATSGFTTTKPSSIFVPLVTKSTTHKPDSSTTPKSSTIRPTTVPIRPLTSRPSSPKPAANRPTYKPVRTTTIKPSSTNKPLVTRTTQKPLRPKPTSSINHSNKPTVSTKRPTKQPTRLTTRKPLLTTRAPSTKQPSSTRLPTVTTKSPIKSTTSAKLETTTQKKISTSNSAAATTIKIPTIEDNIIPDITTKRATTEKIELQLNVSTVQVPTVEVILTPTVKPEINLTKTTEKPMSTQSNEVLYVTLNTSSLPVDVNGNIITNEIETVKPIPELTTRPSLVTWTSANEEPTIGNFNTTDEDWVPITTPDGWVLLPSVSSTTANNTVMGLTLTTTSAPEAVTQAQTNYTQNEKEPIMTSTWTPETSTKDDNYTQNVTGSSETTNLQVDVNITEAENLVNMTDFTDVCGRRMYPKARIVGGENSSFGKWPWQISLRQWRTSTYLHKCGAALLNENWAITAAHCVDSVPPSDLLLRLGEHDLSTESEPYLHQERRVQIVASHPQFDPRTFEYDLALLRFYEPVKFQPNILPVCVPQTDDDFIGSNAYVTGWGRLYEDGPLPSILQEVSVPVINNTLCESMYRSAGYIEHIPHIFICAGWRKGGFDSCEGDSGGPMVIQRPDKRFLLAGVISWGIGCAEPNQPGVYTRISEFRDWINQILQF